MKYVLFYFLGTALFLLQWKIWTWKANYKDEVVDMIVFSLLPPGALIGYLGVPISAMAGLAGGLYLVVGKLCACLSPKPKQLKCEVWLNREVCLYCEKETLPGSRSCNDCGAPRLAM